MFPLLRGLKLAQHPGVGGRGAGLRNISKDGGIEVPMKPSCYTLFWGGSSLEMKVKYTKFIHLYCG